MKTHRFRCHAYAGFSLVELLVVIVVLAVLAGILIPSLLRVRQSSLAVECTNRIRTLGTAVMMYANEHNGTLPEVYQPENGANYRWARLIMPQLESAELGQKEGQDAAKIIDCFRCPLDEIERGDQVSAMCSYGYSFAVQEGDIAGTTKALSVYMIEEPSSTILLGDRWMAANTVNFSVGIDRGRTGNFHMGENSNYFFADGHVEALPRTEVIDPSYWQFQR